MKIVCIKKIENFIINNTYKSNIYSGFVFSPYIIKEDIQIYNSNNVFSPHKAIKSRYVKKMINDKETLNTNYQVYYDDTEHEIFNSEEFNKHFISLKEYRKLKLEKINRIYSHYDK